MLTSFRLTRKQLYPWWFASTATVVGVVFYALPVAKQTPELLLSLLGTVAAFFHFLYAQHKANTDRFAILFKDFNERCSNLNTNLNRIKGLQANALIDSAESQVLYDYFNLCAEEYLYFKAGYIDAEVWASWIHGMNHFAESTLIRSTWARELEQGSYYGFTLSILKTKT